MRKQTERPLEAGDVVRIVAGATAGRTGVVNRSESGSVNVFVTQNNPAGIGVWYFASELKRIGRVSR